MMEKLELHELADLGKMGEWCPKRKLWKRHWPLPESQAVQLWEDYGEGDTHGIGYLWPCGLSMAKFVDAQLRSEVGAAKERPRVLELGAGLGLTSLVAANCGAACVATERGGVPLDLLHRAVADNAACFSATAGSVHVEELDWSQRGAAESVIARHGKPSLVVGSDVCYNYGCLPLLMQALLEVCTAAPDAAVYIAQDMSSVPGGGNICKRFFKGMLPDKGFFVQPTRSDDLLGDAWGNEDIWFYRIKLYPQWDARPLRPQSVYRATDALEPPLWDDFDLPG